MTLSTQCPGRLTRKWYRIQCLQRAKHTKMKRSLWWWDLFRPLFLRGPTSGLVHVHEDHFLIGCQDGVKLLMTNRGQLCHVPSLTLVHGHMDDPQGALQGPRDGDMRQKKTNTRHSGKCLKKMNCGMCRHAFRT